MATNKTPFTFHIEDKYLEKCGMWQSARQEVSAIFWNIFVDYILKNMNRKMVR